MDAEHLVEGIIKPLLQEEVVCVECNDVLKDGTMDFKALKEGIEISIKL